MRYALFFLIALIFLSGCAGPAADNAASDDFADEPTKGSSDSSDDFADEPTKQQSDSLLPLCLGVQDRMYMKMCSAAMSGDASQCDKVYHDTDIDTQYYQAICRVWVAAGNQDTASCKGLSTTIGGATIDCEMMVAEASGDLATCKKLPSENQQEGCSYQVKLAKGDVPLSDCIETECVFEYALVNQDKSACAKFPDVTTAFLDESKYACEAMVDKKDMAHCRKAPGGLFGFTMCSKKAGIGRAYLGDGDFEPMNCGDEPLCIRDILTRMVSAKARG